jgi:hypothetical protein
MIFSSVGFICDKGAASQRRPVTYDNHLSNFIIFLSDFFVFLHFVSVWLSYYSTVTDFARLRGLSTSVPRASAVW